MKIKERWHRAGQKRYGDYFPKVPWWLRVKRFAGKPRSDEEYFGDCWDEYLDYMADPPEEV